MIDFVRKHHSQKEGNCSNTKTMDTEKDKDTRSLHFIIGVACYLTKKNKSMTFDRK